MLHGSEKHHHIASLYLGFFSSCDSFRKFLFVGLSRITWKTGSLVMSPCFTSPNHEWYMFFFYGYYFGWCPIFPSHGTVTPTPDWTIADFWIYVWSFLLVNGLFDHGSIDVHWKWISTLQPLQFLSFFRVYIYIYTKQLYDMFIHFWTYWVIVIVNERTGAKWNKLASNEVLTQLTKPISLTVISDSFDEFLS